MKLRNYLNFNPKVELRAIRVKTDTVLCDENSMIISLFARTI